MTAFLTILLFGSSEASLIFDHCEKVLRNNKKKRQASGKFELF